MKRFFGWFLVFGGGALILFAIILSFRLSDFYEKPNQDTEKIVDKIKISLKDITLGEINSGEKNTVYSGNEIRILDSGFETMYNDVEMRGRGNTTWLAAKKPYQLKFTEKTDLFHLGKAKTWVLLASYYDYSYMRAPLSGILEKILGFDYYSDGKFVELYVDNEDVGLYFLTKKINTSTIKLRDPKGIMVELSNININAWDVHETTPLGTNLILRDAVTKDPDVETEVFREFVRDFSELEVLAKNQDYAGVSELIDIDSFAKYFLISEISENLDAYKTSCYFYRDGNDDKIHAGPAWDFDIAFGNDERIGEDEYLTTSGFMAANVYENPQAADLYYELMKMPEFLKKVSEIFYSKLDGREMEIFTALESEFSKIADLAEIDLKKWHPEEQKNAPRHFYELIEWTKERFSTIREILNE